MSPADDSEKPLSRLARQVPKPSQTSATTAIPSNMGSRVNPVTGKEITAFRVKQLEHQNRIRETKDATLNVAASLVGLPESEAIARAEAQGREVILAAREFIPGINNPSRIIIWTTEGIVVRAEAG